MSLVPNSEPSDLRIYRPNFIDGLPGPQELSESRAHVLRKISSAYGMAQRALETSDGEAPACSSSLCVGLLDPVSNIVINSLIISYKRKRVCEDNGEDPERRSLDGMVAFLTRLFPDLAEGQAVRYLFLADADVLVAACILVSDAGMRRFYGSGPAIMEMALLKCAALAAGHPNPDRLVRAWCGISDRIYAVLGLLDRLASGHVPIVVNKLRRMLNEGPTFGPEHDASWAWQLAAARRRQLRRRPRVVPYRHTRLLTRTLHDAVHGFYLRALARLPAGELRSRFHRSLLRAGYCYGPLDPVSNIIVNTVWYDAAFPQAKTLELDTIGMESFQRMENRSLYGMVSFLCTRYHRLGLRRAVRRLLQADADLVLADHNLDPANSASGVEQAFLAAAKAGLHPNPDAQVKLLTSCKAMLGSAALSLLQGSNKLSSQDVQRLATLLCPESPSGDTVTLLALSLKGHRYAKLAAVNTRISRKINALLNAYEQMPNGDPKFDLHTICGVNDQVSCLSSDAPPGHHHTHVNFLATPKSPCGGGVPTLFFAELSYGYEDPSFCCPLPLPLPCAAQARCLHCEFMGTRIVHPVGIDFHGGESAFEKVACRKNPDDDDDDSDMDIINHRFDLAESIYCSVKDDSLYDDLDGRKIEKRDLSSMSIKAKILFLATC